MGIFKSIMDKIFHHSSAVAAAPPAPAPAQQSTQPSIAPGASASTQPLQAVDVDAVLTKLASSKGGGGNWRTSIVDLKASRTERPLQRGASRLLARDICGLREV